MLLGDWCHACGQKKLKPEQQTIRWLVGQFVDKLTSMDGKLPRSMGALAFQPGRLGLDWLEGRRARWASPFALFLVVNLLYFLSPPVTDFHLPLVEQLFGQPYSGWAMERVDARLPGVETWVDNNGISSPPTGYRELEESFNLRSEGLSKTLLILHVPLLALMLLLLHSKRGLHYVDHFVIALHYWTFLLLALMVFPRFSMLCTRMLIAWDLISTPDTGQTFWKLGLLGLAILYLAVLLKRVYGQSWLISFVKAGPAFLACGLAHFAFRAVLFALTLSLI